MARVSLKEAYDNKDVVAQIYAIRDIAEGASDTADSAKTTADDAKTYVDTLGSQVEGAVQTANNASASAQTSAETVSQYNTRLTSAEENIEALDNDLGEVETGLNAVTLRVTTAEGNIVTIQGRVTALETADGQNVKINNINAYAVGLTGNQNPIAGNKTWTGQMVYEKTNYGSNLYKHLSADVTAPASGERFMGVNFVDKNGVSMVNLRAGIASNGKCVLGGTIRNSDGTTKYFTLIAGD